MNLRERRRGRDNGAVVAKPPVSGEAVTFRDADYGALILEVVTGGLRATDHGFAAPESRALVAVLRRYCIPEAQDDDRTTMWRIRQDSHTLAVLGTAKQEMRLHGYVSAPLAEREIILGKTGDPLPDLPGVGKVLVPEAVEAGIRQQFGLVAAALRTGGNQVSEASVRFHQRPRAETVRGARPPFAVARYFIAPGAGQTPEKLREAALAALAPWREHLVKVAVVNESGKLALEVGLRPSARLCESLLEAAIPTFQHTSIIGTRLVEFALGTALTEQERGDIEALGRVCTGCVKLTTEGARLVAHIPSGCPGNYGADHALNERLAWLARVLEPWRPDLQNIGSLGETDLVPDARKAALSEDDCGGCAPDDARSMVGGDVVATLASRFSKMPPAWWDTPQGEEALKKAKKLIKDEHGEEAAKKFEDQLDLLRLTSAPAQESVIAESGYNEMHALIFKRLATAADNLLAASKKVRADADDPNWTGAAALGVQFHELATRAQRYAVELKKLDFPGEGSAHSIGGTSITRPRDNSASEALFAARDNTNDAASDLRQIAFDVERTQGKGPGAPIFNFVGKLQRLSDRIGEYKENLVAWYFGAPKMAWPSNYPRESVTEKMSRGQRERAWEQMLATLGTDRLTVDWLSQVGRVVMGKVIVDGIEVGFDQSGSHVFIGPADRSRHGLTNDPTRVAELIAYVKKWWHDTASKFEAGAQKFVNEGKGDAKTDDSASPLAKAALGRTMLKAAGTFVPSAPAKMNGADSEEEKNVTTNPPKEGGGKKGKGDDEKKDKEKAEESISEEQRTGAGSVMKAAEAHIRHVVTAHGFHHDRSLLASRAEYWVNTAHGPGKHLELTTQAREGQVSFSIRGAGTPAGKSDVAQPVLVAIKREVGEKLQRDFPTRKFLHMKHQGKKVWWTYLDRYPDGLKAGIDIELSDEEVNARLAGTRLPEGV